MAATLGLPTLSGCCLFVRPPEARELLAVGFRTPEQAFRTFQLGWRADEPDLEHRALSRDFKERERISRLAYREFRARLVQAEPFLRLGIADARPEGPAEVDGDRARLVLETHGRRIEVRFVLDDFVEVWNGAERILDEHRSFADHTQVDSKPDGSARIWARAELSTTLDPAHLTEIRLGREWKIDDLRLLDPQ